MTVSQAHFKKVITGILTLSLVFSLGCTNTNAPTLQVAVICSQGQCACEHKALGTLLTAGRWGTAWRALKAAPPAEVAAS